VLLVADWVSIVIAVLALFFSWWWHRGSAKDSEETRRIAVAAAEAQGRLANITPWRTEWGNGMVLVVNQTGSVARSVVLELDEPWYFGDGGFEQGRTSSNTRAEHGDVDAGSSVMHVVTTDAGPDFDAMLRVTWDGPGGTRQLWSQPATWSVRSSE
jgi:hypothetical protein